jgi:hypothetical protein
MALTMTGSRPWRGLIVLLTLPLWLGVMSPALAGTVHCTTYEEKTLERWHTICDDGTRAVSRYNHILDRWETTITESPRPSCTARMDPRTKQVEVRCR